MTYNEIKDFIKTNNITKRNVLEETNIEVYKSFCRLSREEKDALIPYKGKYSNFNTLEDFNKFIKDNNITSRGEFDSRFSRVYKLFFNSLTEEEKDLLLPKKFNYKYEFLKTFTDFEEFIKVNNVVSRSYFYRDYPTAYLLFNKLLTSEEREILLPSDVFSSGEESLMYQFDKEGLVYVTQKTFDDLKNLKKLRYDFFVQDKILVEYQGHQHFDINNRYYDPESINRDKLKFEYARDNNIPILYFTNEVKLYEKFGYFTEVITDVDILIQKIKEIGLTSQSES